MAALLILGGVLLLVLSLIWLLILAFQTSLFWGLGSFFPPVLLLFIVRCWAVARKAVVVMALSLVPLTAGFTQLASSDAEKMQALLSLNWRTTADSVAPVSIELHGELHGQAFKPHYGELIDGVLVLREGDDFFAQRELRIALPERSLATQPPRLRLDVLPQDIGALPEIEIMWLSQERSLPEARRISRGYTLHLDLLSQAPNLLVGNFHLVLPPHFKTSMSGEVQLLTNRLRYIDGQVDRHYDNVSTLEYVIEDYLQRRFAVGSARVQPFETAKTLVSPLDVTINADVLGQRRQLALRLIKDERIGWSIAGDQYPKYAPQTDAVDNAVIPQATVESVQSARVNDRRLRFSLQRLLVNPKKYQRVQVHLQTTKGNQVTGRFVGLDAEGALIISRTVKAPGTVSFTVMPADISDIRLLEP